MMIPSFLPLPIPAAPVGRPPGFSPPPNSTSRDWKRWLGVSLLSLLLNLALWLAFGLLGQQGSPPKRPLEVQTVSPEKLEAIRKHWEQKQLLLKAQGQKTDTPDPRARYESDRAVRVEKEQRARITDVLPRPGVPGAPGSNTRSAPRPPSRSLPQSAPRPAPRLSTLGVPMRWTSRPPEKTEAAEAGTSGSAGAAQSLPGDRPLPEGSENLLNTQESRFYSFYSRIYEAIGPLWRSEIQQVPRNQRLVPGVYRTVAEIILTPQGELEDVRILQSAGVRELDQVVVASWRRIGRFPNPPRPLWETQGKVVMSWSFEFHLSSGLQWSPGRSRRL
jgi:TonB family protein